MTHRSIFGAVVERDTDLRQHWANLLRDAGLGRVLRRARPAEMRDVLTAETPLSMLMAGLTAHGDRDGDMLILIAEVRRLAPDAVILAVDHGNRPETTVEAFAAGADDVLHSGDDPKAFQARLGVRLRQVGRTDPQAARLQAIGLTPVEERIFLRLSRVPGEIVSRNELAHELGEEDWSYGDRRFDVHITRIRRKLQDRYGAEVQVRTIRARGYLLEGFSG